MQLLLLLEGEHLPILRWPHIRRHNRCQALWKRVRTGRRWNLVTRLPHRLNLLLATREIASVTRINTLRQTELLWCLLASARGHAGLLLWLAYGPHCLLYF